MSEPINPYSLYERDGMTELTKAAKKLCYLVNTFKPVIEAKFGGNVAIMLLIAAIEALCPLLPNALAEYDAVNRPQVLPPNEPSELLGSDPNAPADVPPAEIT